jgi:uncharacterized protein (DUF2384 family)
MTREEVAGAVTRGPDLVRLRADAGRRVAAVATAVSVATAAWPEDAAAWPDGPAAGLDPTGPLDLAPKTADALKAAETTDALKTTEADAVRLYEQAVLALSGRDRGPR